MSSVDSNLYDMKEQLLYDSSFNIIVAFRVANIFDPPDMFQKLIKFSDTAIPVNHWGLKSIATGYIFSIVFGETENFLYAGSFGRALPGTIERIISRVDANTGNVIWSKYIDLSSSTIHHVTRALCGT